MLGKFWVSGPVILLTLSSACASPVEGLWPPSPKSVQHTMYVSIGTWHAMIAFPIQPEDSNQPLAFSFKKGNSPQHSSLSTCLKRGAMLNAPGIWRERRA